MKKLFFILIFSLAFIGCDKSVAKSDEISDDQLMQNIINAVKVDCNMSDLPANVIYVIEQEYNEYTEFDAKISYGLGYQVSMDGKGYKPGDHNEVYFNMDGKKLESKREQNSKTGFKCFELILPVNFIMPDESTITVEDENDYMTVRLWYENNSGINNGGLKVMPILEWPVNIIYHHDDQSTDTKIINNFEEMKDAKTGCRKWDNNKKYWNCFKLVYPITFKIQDASTTILMEDKEDWTMLKEWHEANPQEEERLTFQYPLDITYSDGSTITINNEEEMENAKENCRK